MTEFEFYRFLCSWFFFSVFVSFSHSIPSLAHHTQISKSVLSNMMESSESWFEEITRNPTMLEFYRQAFTASTSEWTSSLLFMTKENTRFWASLLILKRELWHLETGKCYRPTAVMSENCTSLVVMKVSSTKLTWMVGGTETVNVLLILRKWYFLSK